MRSLTRFLVQRTGLTTNYVAIGVLFVGMMMTKEKVHACSAPSKERKPNVVFILADDLGWSDTELYGKTEFYKTPNVLRLSKLGMTFNRAYSASPLCSPTRASILTGLHPARIGLTTPGCHLPQVILKSKQGDRVGGNMPSFPNVSVTRLDTRFQTMGQVFRNAGYKTAHFGKWHLGHEPYSPLEHGFDIDVPHWPGPGPAGSYVAPWRFPDFDPDIPNEHIEDRMAQEAVAFINSNKDQPFFLNYWMFSVHAPFDAKKELIRKYKGRLKPEFDQRSPTYAAMVESMDDAVGSLLNALEENGLTENTIIVFFSDNGGNMYNEVDGVPATNNRPLRGGKATMFEGGIRVPCIVSFPGQIQPDSRSNLLVQSTDFLPTLIELTGVETTKKPEFDGQSFAEVLTGKKALAKERDLFTYFPHQPKVPDWMPPSACLHFGKWKLIRVFGGGANGSDRQRLFDLKTDPGEKIDLATTHREQVTLLAKKLDRQLAKTQAIIPRKNPRFSYADYDLAKEGKAELKKTGRLRNPNQKKNSNPKNNPSRKDRPRQPLVSGWHPDFDCVLKRREGTLFVESTGNDPHLSFDFEEPLPSGTYRLRLVLSSDSKGTGQFFWQEQGVQPKFIRHRSQTFDLRHDNKVQTCSLKFSSPNSVLAVRLDPGRGPGTIRIESLKLINAEGKEIDLLDSTDKGLRQQ